MNSLSVGFVGAAETGFSEHHAFPFGRLTRCSSFARKDGHDFRRSLPLHALGVSQPATLQTGGFRGTEFRPPFRRPPFFI